MPPSNQSNAVNNTILLPASVLVNCLMENLNIACTTDDINRPTPARTVELCTSLANEILHNSLQLRLKEEMIGKIQRELTHESTHKDSIAFMVFYRQFNKLVTQVGVDDFSLKDLMSPEPARIRLIFSHIINFLRFREEKMQLFESCSLKSEDLLNKREELAVQHSQVSEQLHILKERRRAEEPRVQELKQRNATLGADLRELKRQQEILDSNISTIKNDREVLTQKIANEEVLLNNRKQEAVRLRSRIVHNPEKLKQAITEMSDSVVTHKQDVAEAEHRLFELNQKIDALSIADSQVEAYVKALGSSLEGVKSAQEAAAKLNKEVESLELKRNELSDMDIKIAQLRRMESSAKDKLARLEQHYNSKTQSAEAKLATLKEEYDVMMIERASAIEKTEANDASSSGIQRKAIQLKSQMEAELQGLADQQAQLHQHMLAYQARMSKVMKL